MLKLLLNPWVLGGVAVFYVASVGYSGIKGYSWGVAHEQAKAAEERERIHDVNLAALAASRRRIAEMDKFIERQAEQLREADDQGSRDPDAGRIALGPDSVRRINAVRH